MVGLQSGDANGDFETIQRAGTCCTFGSCQCVVMLLSVYRCILSCLRYLLKSDGLNKGKQKQFLHRIRRGFLLRTAEHLDNAEFAARFLSSDRAMVEMACNQTALSAVKLHKMKAGMDEKDLDALQRLVGDVSAKALRLVPPEPAPPAFKMERSGARGFRSLT